MSSTTDMPIMPMMDVVMAHGDYDDVLACAPRYENSAGEHQNNAETLAEIGRNHKLTRVSAAVYILNSKADTLKYLSTTPLMGWVEVLREREKEPGKFSRVGYLA